MKKYFKKNNHLYVLDGDWLVVILIPIEDLVDEKWFIVDLEEKFAIKDWQNSTEEINREEFLIHLKKAEAVNPYLSKLEL